MIGFKENNQWAGLGTGIAIKKLYLWRLRCIQIFIPNPVPFHKIMSMIICMTDTDSQEHIPVCLSTAW